MARGCVWGVFIPQGSGRVDFHQPTCKGITGSVLTEESNGHGDTLANESREVRNTGPDSVPTRSGGHPGTGVEEVEDILMRADRSAIAVIIRHKAPSLTSWSSSRLTRAASLAAVRREAILEAASARTDATAVAASAKRRA